MKHLLLDRLHRTPEGTRIRLRMARLADRDGLVLLLGELGLAAGELEVRRALRCHPGRSWAVVATAWDGTSERLVGLGRLGERGEVTLVAAEPDVRTLLHEALGERAHAHVRRVA